MTRFTQLGDILAQVTIQGIEQTIGFVFQKQIVYWSDGLNRKQ